MEKAVISALRAHFEIAAATHCVMANPDAASADTLQMAIQDLMNRLATEGGEFGEMLVASGTLSRGSLQLALNGKIVAKALELTIDDLHPELLSAHATFDLRRRGVEAKIIAGDSRPSPDPYLRTMLIRAYGWARELKSGTQISEIAKREKVLDAYIRTRIQLAFLSPRIQAAILDGTQPPELSLKRLTAVTHPLDWDKQERMFGFVESDASRI